MQKRKGKERKMFVLTRKIYKKRVKRMIAHVLKQK